jgi:hypothetical protein
MVFSGVDGFNMNSLIATIGCDKAANHQIQFKGV